MDLKLNNSEVYGRKKKTHWKTIWKIILTIGIVGIGSFIASIEIKGSEKSSILLARRVYRHEDRLYPDNFSSPFVSRDDSSSCKRIEKGVYLCGSQDLYKRASKITKWYGEQKTIKAKITAYVCEDAACINAKGYRPIEGYSIACPRAYKLGTWVSGRFGRRYCDDRTSLRYDGRFDLFLSNRKEAIKWGIQTLEITVNE